MSLFPAPAPFLCLSALHWAGWRRPKSSPRWDRRQQDTLFVGRSPGPAILPGPLPENRLGISSAQGAAGTWTAGHLLAVTFPPVTFPPVTCWASELLYPLFENLCPFLAPWQGALSMPGPGIQTSPYDLNLRGFLKDYGIHPSASSPVNLKNAAAFGHFQRIQELRPAASFLLSSSPYNHPSVPVFMVLVVLGHPVNGIIYDVAFGGLCRIWSKFMLLHFNGVVH